MFENIANFFKKLMKTEANKTPSKETAKERLHLVLMQDRANVSADFLELMKQEIIEVIKKYIEVEESAIDVRLTNQVKEDGTQGAPSLYANIPILNIKNDVKSEIKKDKEELEEKAEKKTDSLEKEDDNKKEAEENNKDENDKKENIKTKEEKVINKQEVKKKKPNNNIKTKAKSKNNLNNKKQTTKQVTNKNSNNNKKVQRGNTNNKQTAKNVKEINKK